MIITHEMPPEHIDEELRDYLNRRFILFATAIGQSYKFPEIKLMPSKPQVGDIHYFGNPATHSYDAAITAEGWWGYKSTGWAQLA